MTLWFFALLAALCIGILIGFLITISVVAFRSRHKRGHGFKRAQKMDKDDKNNTYDPNVDASILSDDSHVEHANVDFK